MDDHTEPENQPNPQQEEPEIDLEALTNAVERLLRRDLRLERERTFGADRPDNRFS